MLRIRGVNQRIKGIISQVVRNVGAAAYGLAAESMGAPSECEIAVAGPLRNGPSPGSAPAGPALAEVATARARVATASAVVSATRNFSPRLRGLLPTVSLRIATNIDLLLSPYCS